MEPRIAIISEGPTDQIIIKFILKGLFGIDTSQITSLLPTDVLDETDLATIEGSDWSTVSLVVEECLKRSRIDEFLNLPLLEKKIVVIQMDTDVCDGPEINIVRPDKNSENYSLDVISRTAMRIVEILGLNIENISLAISVEQIESWILPLVLPSIDPEKSADPKRRLKRSATYMNLRESELVDKYRKISKEISKRKNLIICRQKSFSLDEFCRNIQILYEA